MAKTLKAKQRRDDVNVGALLDELEEAIEHLKVSYDKYFVGVDKAPPAKERARVERMLRLVEQRRPAATVLRFRLQGLRARLVTYRHYWDRVLRQMENGTYHRDLKRLQRKLQHQPPPEPPSAEQPAAADGERKPKASRPGQGQPQLPPGMDAREARALFKELVARKKAAGENTRGLTYGALVRKLAREAPKLGGKVEFVVATDGGKVRIKAKRSRA